MIGIGVATAAAGTVVGVVTLTGIGLVMTDFVEFISGGNLMLMLIFTAVISLILGMGLPTTANYIVVSTLMAPVIVTLGAEHGLIIPLIAVHLVSYSISVFWPMIRLRSDLPHLPRRRSPNPTRSAPVSKALPTISAPRFCLSCLCLIPSCC